MFETHGIPLVINHCLLEFLVLAVDIVLELEDFLLFQDGWETFNKKLEELYRLIFLHVVVGGSHVIIEVAKLEIMLSELISLILHIHVVLFFI